MAFLVVLLAICLGSIWMGNNSLKAEQEELEWMNE
jgi:hypothetical protein